MYPRRIIGGRGRRLPGLKFLYDRIFCVHDLIFFNKVVILLENFLFY